MARVVETSRPALSIYTTFAREYNQTKQQDVLFEVIYRPRASAFI